MTEKHQEFADAVFVYISRVFILALCSEEFSLFSFSLHVFFWPFYGTIGNLRMLCVMLGMLWLRKLISTPASRTGRYASYYMIFWLPLPWKIFFRFLLFQSFHSIPSSIIKKPSVGAFFLISVEDLLLIRSFLV